MSIAWPSKLPSPQVLLNYSVKTNTITNKMESGKVRQRNRFPDNTKSYSVSLKVDFRQLALFEGFHKYLLENGANSFLLPMPKSEDQSISEIEGVILTGDYSVTDLAATLKWQIDFTFLSDTSDLIPEGVFTILNLFTDGEEFIETVDLVEDEISHLNTLHPF